jgi:predicted acetyltransferase
VTWTARLIEPDELAATIDLTAVAFGAGPRASDDYRRHTEPLLEPDRVFVVGDGDRLAGTAAVYSLHVALPGGTLPLAGVTEVGVLPTDRRRGALRALMAALHEQAIERGEPLAGLTASEGGIYRRFGYGVATRFQSLSIDRMSAAEADVGPATGVDRSIRLVSEDEAVTTLPQVWDRHWRRRAGEVLRPSPWWDVLALDTEHDRGDASARVIAVHDDESGVPDGFAIYRVKQGWGADHLPHELRIESIVAADDASESALLRYLLEVDLVATVRWQVAPVDLPLRWRLRDPRAVRVTGERDGLWLRPLDVASCLASRSYAAEGGLVIEVVDRGHPPVGGRLRLEAGPDGAACSATTAEADVTVAAADLGALLLGGVSWATLQRAGLVDEHSPEAVVRADSLFRVDRAPCCATDF